MSFIQIYFRQYVLQFYLDRPLNYIYKPYIYKMRISAHNLNIETGRFYNLDLTLIKLSFILCIKKSTWLTYWDIQILWKLFLKRISLTLHAQFNLCILYIFSPVIRSVLIGVLQGTRVVVDLMQSSSHLNKGYHVFCDSYFCSINLVTYKKIYMVNILRYPDIMKTIFKKNISYSTCAV
jgi:hypothetical protein